MRIGSFFAIAAVVLAAPPCAAQRGLVDSSATRILAENRGGFPSTLVIDVLRQRSKAQPVARREELADSVVAVAIRTRGAFSAVYSIGAAGYATAPGDPGVAEPRALDWLIRVHRQSQDADTRMAALLQMTKQREPSRALPYLRSIAVSRDDPTAWIGLAKMIELVRNDRLMPGSERQLLEAQLREMWDGRLVTDPRAMTVFRNFAAERRWPFPNR